MKTLIEEATTEEKVYKDQIEDMRKKLNHMEHNYQKGMDSLLPKEMESLRMTIDPTPFTEKKSHYTMRFSKKVMNKLLGTAMK